MHKANCWEALNCGREPGGRLEHELGACPAATETAVDGLHAGVNGGRVCWAVVGTLCEGEVQGTYAQKLQSCVGCRFYERVTAEEGDMIHPADILKMVKK